MNGKMNKTAKDRDKWLTVIWTLLRSCWKWRWIAQGNVKRMNLNQINCNGKHFLTSSSFFFHLVPFGRNLLWNVSAEGKCDWPTCNNLILCRIQRALHSQLCTNAICKHLNICFMISTRRVIEVTSVYELKIKLIIIRDEKVDNSIVPKTREKKMEQVVRPTFAYCRRYWFWGVLWKLCV